MVSINAEIVRAIGLSSIFMGIMLSFVSLGVGVLVYKISKKNRKQYSEMFLLIVLWAIFIALNSQSSISPNYLPVLWAYSVYHLFSIVVAVVVLVLFLCMFSSLWEVLDHGLLIYSGVFAFCGFGMRLLFPFFTNPYLATLQRFVVVVPPIMGFFMMIKLYVGKEND